MCVCVRAHVRVCVCGLNFNKKTNIWKTDLHV